MSQNGEFSASASDLEEDYSTGNGSTVYIALVDAPLKENEDITIEDTFIGGKPVWLHQESLPNERLLQCGACKSKDNMKLLLQAFCPLDPEQVQNVQAANGLDSMEHVSADDDRVLYVFLCTKCQRKSNSVRCIRGVRKNSKKSVPDMLSQKMEKLVVQKDFKINPFDISSGGDANPFNSNPFQSAGNGSNPFGSSAKINEGSNEKSVNEISSKASRKLHDAKADRTFDESEAFKSFLLYVEEESFRNKKPDHLKLPKNLKIDKDALDLTGEDEANLGKDPIKLDPRTEKLSKFLDDDVFQKFQEVVGYNPLQVLRYDFGGKPLLYAQSKVDFVKTVANPAYNPSSKRVFEMQLMPKLIMDLEKDVSLAGGMEWGTIMIFTDLENYTPDFDDKGVGYVEEIVKVQWESRN